MYFPQKWPSIGRLDTLLAKTLLETCMYFKDINFSIAQNLHQTMYLISMCNWVERKEDIDVKNQFLAIIICLLNCVWDVFVPHSEELSTPSILKSVYHFLLKWNNPERKMTLLNNYINFII